MDEIKTLANRVDLSHHALSAVYQIDHLLLFFFAMFDSNLKEG